MIAENPSLPEQVARLFPGRWKYHYVKSKLTTDPLYSAVFDALKDNQLPLLDIGCGMGLLSFYLTLSGLRFPITGTDFDGRKIALANSIRAGRFPHLDFLTADVQSGLTEHLGSVTLLDVLQYLPPAAQQSLLQAAAQRVAPGGVLVLRTGLRDASWRYKLTHAADAFARLIRWMKSPPLQYPTVEEILTHLPGPAFTTTVTSLWGRTPFNNYLMIARRSPVSQEARELAASPER